MFTMFGVFCDKSAGAVRKDYANGLVRIWNLLKDNVLWEWPVKTWTLMTG